MKDTKQDNEFHGVEEEFVIYGVYGMLTWLAGWSIFAVGRMESDELHKHLMCRGS